MARVISVYLPLWPIDRLRRQAPEAAPSPEAPLVLASRVGNRRLVTAACSVAQELGLHAGMPVSKAQALVPGVQVLPSDPANDAASLERLAFWVLQRVSPIVAVDPPDGLVIDSTGADHLHGGEAALLETLIGRLVMSGSRHAPPLLIRGVPLMRWPGMRPIPCTWQRWTRPRSCSRPCPFLRCGCRLRPSPTSARSARLHRRSPPSTPRATDPALRSGTLPAFGSGTWSCC
jgi:hypothetical protein